MTVHELDTPALVIDLDICERNLRAMQAACDEGGCDLRPHIKTHKMPAIARWQLALGAVGLTCAKLGEAEVMLEQADCHDLFVAYPILGEAKFGRLQALLDRADVRVAVVGAEQAALFSRGMGGRSIKVRLTVDCGLGRDGVDLGQAVAEAERIAALRGLELVGLFTHEGQAHHAADPAGVNAVGERVAQQLVEVAERMRAAGLPVTEVSPGATPTAAHVAGVEGVTEVRPGTYCFYDIMCAEHMGLSVDDCAGRVITTVVDLPTRERVIVDGGSKTFFNDQTEPWGRARCLEHPRLKLYKCSEEHGQATWEGDGPPPVRLGDRLTFLPTHICPVVNLFDAAWAVRGEEVVDRLEIAARGKVR